MYLDAGLNTAQLDVIVALGGYPLLPTLDADGFGNSTKIAVLAMDGALVKRNLLMGFNLPNFVDAAFKRLGLGMSLAYVVTIGKKSISPAEHSANAAIFFAIITGECTTTLD